METTKVDVTNQIINLTETYSYRPDWDEYFITIAFLTASRSPCERLHVGTAFVKDKHLIAHGYNGFLPGAKHKSVVIDGHEKMTVHAEQNAIADCAKRGVSVLGCTVYITHYPCIDCAKIMAAAGVGEIKYRDDYYNDPLVSVILEEGGVKITQLKKKCTT